MGTQSTSNWLYEKNVISEIARKATEKAHIMENARAKKGWRWIALSPRTKVFVPCDKNGTPTEKGRKIIRETKKRMV